MLHALTKEETTETFHVLLDNFVDLMHSQGKVVPDEEVLGDAAAFAGVSKYPARVKCALLLSVVSAHLDQLPALRGG